MLFFYNFGIPAIHYIAGNKNRPHIFGAKGFHLAENIIKGMSEYLQNEISASMIISGISSRGSIRSGNNFFKFLAEGFYLFGLPTSYLLQQNVHHNPADVPCRHEWLRTN